MRGFQSLPTNLSVSMANKKLVIKNYFRGENRSTRDLRGSSNPLLDSQIKKSSFSFEFVLDRKQAS